MVVVPGAVLAYGVPDFVLLDDLGRRAARPVADGDRIQVIALVKVLVVVALVFVVDITAVAAQRTVEHDLRAPRPARQQVVVNVRKVTGVLAPVVVAALFVCVVQGDLVAVSAGDQVGSPTEGDIVVTIDTGAGLIWGAAPTRQGVIGRTECLFRILTISQAVLGAVTQLDAPVLGRLVAG